jgi:hypothetical protein
MKKNNLIFTFFISCSLENKKDNCKTFFVNSSFELKINNCQECEGEHLEKECLSCKKKFSEYKIEFDKNKIDEKKAEISSNIEKWRKDKNLAKELFYEKLGLNNFLNKKCDLKNCNNLISKNRQGYFLLERSTGLLSLFKDKTNIRNSDFEIYFCCAGCFVNQESKYDHFEFENFYLKEERDFNFEDLFFYGENLNIIEEFSCIEVEKKLCSFNQKKIVDRNSNYLPVLTEMSKLIGFTKKNDNEITLSKELLKSLIEKLSLEEIKDLEKDLENIKNEDDFKNFLNKLLFKKNKFEKYNPSNLFLIFLICESSKLYYEDLEDFIKFLENYFREFLENDIEEIDIKLLSKIFKVYFEENKKITYLQSFWNKYSLNDIYSIEDRLNILKLLSQNILFTNFILEKICKLQYLLEIIDLFYILDDVSKNLRDFDIKILNMILDFNQIFKKIKENSNDNYKNPNRVSFEYLIKTILLADRVKKEKISNSEKNYKLEEIINLLKEKDDKEKDYKEKDYKEKEHSSKPHINFKTSAKEEKISTDTFLAEDKSEKEERDSSSDSFYGGRTETNEFYEERKKKRYFSLKKSIKNTEEDHHQIEINPYLSIREDSKRKESQIKKNIIDNKIEFNETTVKKPKQEDHKSRRQNGVILYKNRDNFIIKKELFPENRNNTYNSLLKEEQNINYNYQNNSNFENNHYKKYDTPGITNMNYEKNGTYGYNGHTPIHDQIATTAFFPYNQYSTFSKTDKFFSILQKNYYQYYQIIKESYDILFYDKKNEIEKIFENLKVGNPSDKRDEFFKLLCIYDYNLLLKSSIYLTFLDMLDEKQY